MSANNLILILEKKNGFSIYDKDIDCPLTSRNYLTFTKTLREAVKKAQQFIEDEDNEVEYGIQFVLLDK